MQSEYYVSGRMKDPDQDMMTYLQEHFPQADNIKSVYGFLNKINLYGGRVWRKPDFTEKDVQDLYNNNIGLELPLTNQHWDIDDYYNNEEFIAKHHRAGNIITCHSRRLADLIRRDYPDYKLKLSVTHITNTAKEINNVPDVFDYVVVHPKFNNHPEFLKRLINKDRIILFGSCGCIATCHGNGHCYSEISKKNYYDVPIQNICYKEGKDLLDSNQFFKYDLEPLIDLGFSKFKLNRENAESIKKAY